VADLLARRGLAQKRHARRKPLHPGVVCPTTDAPNDLWTADFKGQFRTGDGQYCYPLTLADQHTRYLLACRALLCTQTVTAKPIFERAFRVYGLTLAIRTDNGVPFSMQAIHGLSYLDVWSLRLGIAHRRSRPSCPQDNGADERMHCTLKRQAITPVRATCTAQQRTFDAFRAEYNDEGPHEHLGQQIPASQCRTSARPYPERLPVLEYRAISSGRISRAAARSGSSTASSSSPPPCGPTDRPEETDNGIPAIHFNGVPPATSDERDYIVTGYLIVLPILLDSSVTHHPGCSATPPPDITRSLSNVARSLKPSL
jgi:transposase InsO family protein